MQILVFNAFGSTFYMKCNAHTIHFSKDHQHWTSFEKYNEPFEPLDMDSAYKYSVQLALEDLLHPSQETISTSDTHVTLNAHLPLWNRIFGQRPTIIPTHQDKLDDLAGLLLCDLPFN